MAMMWKTFGIGFAGLAGLLLGPGCGGSTATDSDGEIEGDEGGECSDGADNDQDGDFDCDDEGCTGSPDCDDVSADADTDSDSDTDTDADGDSDADSDTDTDTDTDVDDSCADHDECEWDEMCDDSECTGVLGRRFKVGIASATVDTDNPEGDDWDIGGGAPDLFVEFYMEGGDSCQTSTKSDDFSPSWNESCSFVFDDGGTLWFELWDEDTSDHDLGAAWYAEGSDALVDLARSDGATQTATDNSGTIRLRFTVRPDF